MRYCSLIYAIAVTGLIGCEGGENARKNGAVLNDSQQGVITAPQEGTEMPADDLTTTGSPAPGTPGPN